MIHKIFANKSSFRPVVFEPGFNVVLAEKDSSSDEGDSRNGIGKTSLIEIIHFCLGSDLSKSITLKKEQLADWVFNLEITIAGERVIIERSIVSPGQVYLNTFSAQWPIQPSLDEETGKRYYSLAVWNELLGKLMFNLPMTSERKLYEPTFRSLISYFIRRGRDAYSRAFEYRRGQSAWQVQVYNAYLLGLSWELAREWQVIKDKEEDLTALKSASERGSFSEIIGSIGELEAVKLRLDQNVLSKKAELQSFRVHPNYRELEQKADSLTEKIHSLSNDNFSGRRVITNYAATLRSEDPASAQDVARLYQDAGVHFGEALIKRLDEVVAFHNSVAANRASFLKEEIKRVNREIESREKQIEFMSNERAELLVLLRNHGALEEHSRLQEALNRLVAQAEETMRKLELLKRFEEGKSAVRIEKEELKISTRRDYEDRLEVRSRIISLFNENSQALYNRPGQLIIDVTSNGYKFRIEIERSGSDGIQLMEVFCYDLVLSQLWAAKESKPGFIIHDSSVFADVDERQIASALKIAHSRAGNQLQYICFLNSDKVPWDQFGDDFNLREFVRLELKDEPESACLFGVRF